MARTKKKENKKKCKYNKSIKLKKLKCSPLSDNNFSCYSDKSLHIIKKYWNMKHPDCTIHDTDSKKIWEKLKSFLGNVCDTEKCWLNQKFIKNGLNADLLHYTFAPNSPDTWKENPRTWLSSVDIEKVMKQYEKKYSNFRFIGPSPIDFDSKKLYGECVWDELCKLNLSKMLKKGVNLIGVIFNTDPHYKEGSHWISLFINLKINEIYFYDSVGDEPPKEIVKLVKRIQKQGIKIKRKITFTSNVGIDHQKKNTECGIYSLHFIINMIEGSNFNKFTDKNKLIPDDEIFNYRKIYFNN